MSRWSVHTRQVVGVECVEVDAAIWDAVRAATASLTTAPRRAKEWPVVIPVVERNGHLIALAEFQLVATALRGGVRLLTVWIADIAPGEDLVEYASGFASAT